MRHSVRSHSQRAVRFAADQSKRRKVKADIRVHESGVSGRTVARMGVPGFVKDPARNYGFSSSKGQVSAQSISSVRPPLPSFGTVLAHLLPRIATEPHCATPMICRAFRWLVAQSSAR
jgi:hypothetical protein